MSRNKAFLRRPDGRPDITNDVAYHLENEKFVEFLEAQRRRIGVEVADATVVDVRTDDNGVAGLVLDVGAVETADLYVDCSGFRSVLLGKALGEPYISFKTQPVLRPGRRRRLGPRARTSRSSPTPTAETMDAGWCWQIEHEQPHQPRLRLLAPRSSATRTPSGSSGAKNPKVGPTRVVKFITGRYERAWVKNVVAIGNASGFVEPLRGDRDRGDLHDHAEPDRDARGQRPATPARRCGSSSTAATPRTGCCSGDFLAMHYKFNTRSDTPFWQACREKTDLAGCEDAVEQYQENGPSNIWCGTVLNQRDQFGAEGYISMLVGMKVPYRKRHVASPKEQSAWAAVKRAVANKTNAGVGVAETLAAIRSPGWQWPKGIYN